MKFAQKLTNNNDWAAKRTLSFIRTRVSTGVGRESWM